MAKSIETNRHQVVEGPLALVGKWFHSFDDDGDVLWQGQIIAHVDDAYYLVQLHESGGGDKGPQRLTTLAQMTEWQIYEAVEQMREWYDRYGSEIADGSLDGE